MRDPNEPFDEERLNEDPPPPLPLERSASGPSRDREPQPTPLELLKAWMATVAIPVPITLGALVFAAFLLFPAYKGLSSGSTIRQLEQANQDLQKQKDAMQVRTIELERDLAGRDLQLTQRQRQGEGDTGSGLYLSPLLYLDGRKKAPDLINIDFTRSDRAILVFSLPKLELQELEVARVREHTAEAYRTLRDIHCNLGILETLVTFDQSMDMSCNLCVLDR